MYPQKMSDAKPPYIITEIRPRGKKICSHNQHHHKEELNST